MKLTKNLILVDPDDALKQNYGIVLDDMGTADQAPITGTVKHVGDKVVELKVGDRVLFEQGTGLRKHFDEGLLLLMDEDSVLGIVDTNAKVR